METTIYVTAVDHAHLRELIELARDTGVDSNTPHLNLGLWSQDRYFININSLCRSLYTSSSTSCLVSRMPRPPGRSPFWSRTSEWRIGSSLGLLIAACSRCAGSKPPPGSLMRHMIPRLRRT